MAHRSSKEKKPVKRYRDNEKKCAAYLIIEIYWFYDEIFFLDEFYVWNNKKNGAIYSWFDRGKEPSLESTAEY